MLRFAYGPNGNSLLTGITGFDSSQQYRYTKLYRLGATNNGRAKMLDEELSTLGQTLTPAQIADADSWAQSSISAFPRRKFDRRSAVGLGCVRRFNPSLKSGLNNPSRNARFAAVIYSGIAPGCSLFRPHPRHFGAGKAKSKTE